MKLVFFYGLFMDQTLLKSKGLNPSHCRTAYVDGYGVRIGERATLVRADGERTYGVLMSLDDQELRKLYSGDGLADYVPENLVAIDSDGQPLAVISYNLPSAKLSGRNREYAGSLVEVARRLGLPDEYVSQLQRWV